MQYQRWNVWRNRECSKAHRHEPRHGAASLFLGSPEPPGRCLVTRIPIMALTPAHRIRSFKPTVFAEMSELSARHGAVNLGQGFPDFPGPGFVKEAAKRAIDRDANQYAHPAGLPRLRSAIAADWGRRFHKHIDPRAEVTVTSGATEAIFDFLLAWLNPGDELITFEPFYDSYPAAVELAGASMKVIRLEPPTWLFDLAELERAVSPRTRVILLNTPHNPSGKVFSREELDGIARIALEHDLIVVTDEVYDRITFDGVSHTPIATLPEMYDRTLTINSTGKTFSLTGWKIGYAVGPEPLNAALRAVHQFVTFATSTPFQEAMADGMEEAAHNGYYGELAEAYDDRRQALTNCLTEAGFDVLPVQGSYFLMAGFERFGFHSDVDFCRWLITEIGVAAIPPSAFYRDPTGAPKLVRFCFAKQLTTIEGARRRLRKLRGNDNAEPYS